MKDSTRRRIYAMHKQGKSIDTIALLMAMKRQKIRSICADLAREERKKKRLSKRMNGHSDPVGQTDWMSLEQCAEYIGCDPRALPFLVGTPDGERWGLEKKDNKYRVNRSAQDIIVETI